MLAIILFRQMLIKWLVPTKRTILGWTEERAYFSNSHQCSIWNSSGTIIGWSHCLLHLEGGNPHSNGEAGISIFSLHLVAKHLQSSMTLLAGIHKRQEVWWLRAGITASWPGFKFQLCHLLAVCFWATSLNSLCLSFPICKIVTMTVAISWALNELVYVKHLE